ncbi:MAG: glutamine--tRNA ligase/YqeY domain fusion protein, partial [Gemmatimonadetes bacterium]|nr:glutamine--tRNA ligase/YqeY domain fusion protein [Gemmatimonadota bacterium]
PETEEMRYVDAAKRDVRWLGFEWDGLYFASDYFEQLYAFAEKLVHDGKAYVDSLSEEQIREYRGSVTQAGRPSPYRDRSVGENLDLFRRMKAGEFPDGAHVLRAKIDMGHPNMVMRDPVLWRIRHHAHYRRGTDWVIYPLYDFTHGLSDAIEDITHSFCTLEFENNREIYDWLVDHVGFEEPRTHQYEFARRNFDYTIVSKRKLLRLVNEGHVTGWDDPRMPTISGLRRRGVTPEALRAFCDMIGVARADNRADISKLEFAIRDDLNTRVPRVMAVTDPLKVVITNWPEDTTDTIEAPLYPHDVPLEGSRPLPFGRELWIERADFAEDPPKGFHRLAPGREVRLRYGYLITCQAVIKDEDGTVVALHCTYDPATRGGDAPDGRSVKGTLHWVSAAHALPCELRLYDRLFTVADPEDVPEGRDFTDVLNPDSLVVRHGWIEPSVADDPPGTAYQFERLGYFVSDTEDSKPGALVFNRTVTLRDTWGKSQRVQVPVIEIKSSVHEGSATSTPDRQDTGQAAKPAERPAHHHHHHHHHGHGHGPTEAEKAIRDRRRPGREAERFDRYVGLEVPILDADVIAREDALATLMDDALAGPAEPSALAKWIVNDVRRETKDRPLRLTGRAFAELVALVETEEITTGVGREALAELLETGGDPRDVALRIAAARVDDRSDLAPLVERLLADHPDKATALKEGRDSLMGFFVGEAKKATQGKADPRLVQEIVREKL